MLLPASAVMAADVPVATYRFDDEGKLMSVVLEEASLVFDYDRADREGDFQSLSVTHVPEPGSHAMAWGAVGSLLCLRVWRRARSNCEAVTDPRPRNGANMPNPKRSCQNTTYRWC